jgi:putative redox protein
MSKKVTVKWIASQYLTGADSNGNTLVMGSWPEREPEWEGLKPADLLLLSAASCTAWDVAMILNKQRQPLKGLEVHCTGIQAEDYPRVFTDIHVHYLIEGECNLEKVARAIQLSEDRYCSVINTLKKAVRVTSDFEVIFGE